MPPLGRPTADEVVYFARTRAASDIGPQRGFRQHGMNALWRLTSCVTAKSQAIALTVPRSGSGALLITPKNGARISTWPQGTVSGPD